MGQSRHHDQWKAHLMASASLAGYRKQWPRIGAVLGMAVGGATVLSAKKMTKLQVLSAANLIALLVHQYEEYKDPGYGGTQINRVIGSESPRNYPLNTHSAMCINTGIAYPAYLAPILFPTIKWLGMGPVYFGMSQAGLHGIAPKVRLDEWYGPGFLSSALLHVPIGLTYLHALKEVGEVTRGDYAKGIAYGVAFFAFGLGAPNFLMRDKNSPYPFTREQMGPYPDPHDSLAAKTEYPSAV
jgi:Protein of unknown function with HXXEE motif